MRGDGGSTNPASRGGRPPLIAFLIVAFFTVFSRAAPDPASRAAEFGEAVAQHARSALVYRQGLAELVRHVKERPDVFAPEGGDGTLPTRERKEAMWAAWQKALDYYLALESLRAYHADFLNVADRKLQASSFAVCYSSFLSEYRHALELIDLLDRDPAAQTILNEPVPELGLSGGNYSAFKFRFLNVVIATEFAALEVLSPRFTPSPFPDLQAGIDEDRRAIWEIGKGRGEAMTLKNAVTIARQGGSSAWLPVQKGVATWMGNVRVRRPGLFHITETQIREMIPFLKPGDILLQRREWYLSNVGLPGFWTHAALYVGTPGERSRFFDDDAVRARFPSPGGEEGPDIEGLLEAQGGEAYGESLALGPDGHEPRVLEAIAEGVVFTTLEHSAHADSLAVLRPRIGKAEVAEALLAAFRYAGRPYDYDFDFLTDEKLVCSELIYKAYEPTSTSRGVRFPLEELAGRMVMPPNLVAKLFDGEYGEEGRQFDLVLFLDGQEKEGRAVAASAEEFRRSWKRPKWHILVQDAAGGME